MNIIEAFKVGTPIRRTGRKHWMVKDKDGEKEITIDPELDQWADPMHFLKFIADADDILADDYEAAEKRAVITERDFESLIAQMNPLIVDVAEDEALRIFGLWRKKLGFDK
jgi:hypothetical protein